MKGVDAPQATLAGNVARWTEGREDVVTPIPNLMLFRRARPTPPSLCLIEPSVVLVVQGAKTMFIGGEAHTSAVGRLVVTSLNVPGQSQVTEASPDKPCLGIGLRLDLRLMAELIAQGARSPIRERPSDRSIIVSAVTPAVKMLFERLVALLDEPEAIPFIAPLIEREIHYRLLMSDQAAHLWQVALAGSQSHRIVAAIDWLKMNYAFPLRIDDLAARARMSATTFHHHFRQLTAMSPLQYQKWLRLSEARRLMLNEDFDAAAAAFQVGYESPSQFSREYSRLFGAPPRREIGLARSGKAVGAAIQTALEPAS